MTKMKVSIVGVAFIAATFHQPLLADLGDRIDRKLDRKGDRIERRFDHRADIARSNGNYLRANRLERKGNQIDRHLDRKGDRIERRLDRKH